MLRIFSLFFLNTFFSTVLFSQSIIVRDIFTRQPIENVIIFNSDSTLYSISNRGGKADISKFKTNDLLSFQHPAYIVFTLNVSELKKLNYEVKLTEQVISMHEVVIAANRWEQNKNEVSQKISDLSSKEIQFNNPQTAADALSFTGEVFIQKSQLGGGSPVIRGFSANSVMIVVDGVRMNNAIFRSGNVHNIISIDPNLVESAEVLFGPGSVMYGSDALGGVMDFHTISPKFSNSGKTEIKINAFSRFSSANKEKTNHLNYNLKRKKISYFGGFTYSDFDDLRSGSNYPDRYPEFGKRLTYTKRVNNRDSVFTNSDPQVQKFSGYNQFSTLHKLKYKPANNLFLTYSFIHSATSDVPRYDRLIEQRNNLPVSAEWYYGPQKWTMHSLKVDYFGKRWLFDNFKFILAFQDIQESRHDRRFNSNLLRNRFEQVKAWSLNFDFDKEISEKTSLFYGLEGIRNDVISKAFSKNILTGEIGHLNTRYPDDGSDWSSLASYINLKHKIKPNLILNSGFRINNINLNSYFKNSEILPFQQNQITNSNTSFSGSAGIVYIPGNNWKFNLNTGSGFRAPNIDDIAKIFDSEPGNVVVPNPDLRAENVYNVEIGLEKMVGDRLSFSMVGFYSYLKDAMVRRNFQLNGQDSIMYDNRLSRVQALVNTGSAEVYGFNARIKIDVLKDLNFISTITYTEGNDLSENVPWRDAVPLFGQSSLKYEKQKFKGEFFVIYHGARPFDKLPPSEQNKVHLYTENGSLAWYTLNIRSSYQINKVFQVNAVIENLLDKHYRPYSSGISAPGINGIISIRASI
jgi:hemoglobin/transferrin/lactoferrin receptor protein